MSYVIHKVGNYYVFVQEIGSSSGGGINPLIENAPSYVISSIKEQARLASTGNVDLSSTHTTLDGVSLVNGDRVLLVAQSDSTENGIYFWDAGHQKFFRANDFNSVSSGFLISVTEGTANDDTVWMLGTPNPIEVGTTALTFVKVSESGSHASQHIYGGSDPIDGDQLGIDYSPSNYARNTTGSLVSDVHHLTSHLQGIDVALSGIGAAHSWTHESNGLDELDGDKLDIDYTPSNYTRTILPFEVTTFQQLTAHLAGIDNALGAPSFVTYEKEINALVTHPYPGIIAVARFSFDPNLYSEGTDYYFTSILNVSSGTLTGRARLYDTSNHVYVTGTSLTTSSPDPVVLTSSSLTVGSSSGDLQDSETVYEIHIDVSAGGSTVMDTVSHGSSSIRVTI